MKPTALAIAALSICAVLLAFSAPAHASTDYQGEGTLVVITNFAVADVEVNGEPYPAYSDDLQNRGMSLPARQTHQVIVEYGDSMRVYEIELNPGERRMLMVDLTGMDSSGEAPERPQRREARAQRRDEEEEQSDEEEDDDQGRLTVYSRPRGNIHLNGEDLDERTPETLDVDPGRHEVQIEFEDGEMSEVKTARVREGSRVQLFFREDD